MSVNTELQNLLTKMGGSPSEEDSNSDLIKKISTAYEGSGGSSGGSCNCLVVNAVVDPTTSKTTLDKTWSEIHAADFAIIIGPANAIGKVRGFVIQTYIAKNTYMVSVNAGNLRIYVTPSEDGYPSLVEEEQQPSA